MSDQKKGVNTTTAGIIGVVVGTAAASAAIVLSDKNTRKKVEKALNDFRIQGAKKWEEFKKRALQFGEEAEQEIKEKD